jgi:hypothetical protein
MRERIVEGFVPGVEPDLAEGRDADDGDDGEAEQQDLVALRRGPEGADHDLHRSQEAHSGRRRRWGCGRWGRLGGRIWHGSRFRSC